MSVEVGNKKQLTIVLLASPLPVFQATVDMMAIIDPLQHQALLFTCWRDIVTTQPEEA